MNTEIEKVREGLRTLLTFTQTAIPDYATDPVVQVRLGRFLADSAARVRVRPIRDTF